MTRRVGFYLEEVEERQYREDAIWFEGVAEDGFVEREDGDRDHDWCQDDEEIVQEAEDCIGAQVNSLLLPDGFDHVLSHFLPAIVLENIVITLTVSWRYLDDANTCNVLADRLRALIIHLQDVLSVIHQLLLDVVLYEDVHDHDDYTIARRVSSMHVWRRLPGAMKPM
jgi:hypothetical protein